MSGLKNALVVVVFGAFIVGIVKRLVVRFLLGKRKMVTIIGPSKRMMVVRFLLGKRKEVVMNGPSKGGGA